MAPTVPASLRACAAVAVVAGCAAPPDEPIAPAGVAAPAAAQPIPEGSCEAPWLVGDPAVVVDATIPASARPLEPRSRLLDVVWDEDAGVLHGLGVGVHFPHRAAFGSVVELPWQAGDAASLRTLKQGVLTPAGLIAIDADDALVRLDVTDPSSPVVAVEGSSQAVRSLVADDERLVVLMASGDLWMPDPAGDLSDGWRHEGVAGGRAMALAGDRLWIADVDGAVVPVDLSDGVELLDPVPVAGAPQDLVRCGDALFVATGGPGVHVLAGDELSDEGVIPAGSSAAALACRDEVLWVGTREHVAAWDVSKPQAVRPLGRAAVSDRAMALAALPGDRVAVADFRDLQILSVDRHAELASVDVDRTGFVFSGDRREEAITITNRGAGPLDLRGWSVDAEGYALRSEASRLEPGASTVATLEWTGPGEAEPASLCLETNDPATSLLELPIGAAHAPIGLPVPDGRLESLDGDAQSLHDLAGETILLTFFATWCPLCSTELTDLQGVFAPQWEQQGLTVFAVASEDTVEAVEHYVEHRGLHDLNVVMDDGGELQAALAELAGTAPSYPWNWLVGADGRLRYFETTYDAAALQAAIRAELD